MGEGPPDFPFHSNGIAVGRILASCGPTNRSGHNADGRKLFLDHNVIIGLRYAKRSLMV